jgi:PAS domain S-box-containing protein
MTSQPKKKRRAETDAELLGEARRRLPGIEKAGARAIRDKMDRESLLHELQIHRIELEMQNEELRSALAGVQKEKDKYAELFEFLPVGIIVVDGNGAIRETNFATAALVGSDRRALAGRNVRTLIERKDLDRFDGFLDRMLAAVMKLSIEVRLRAASSEQTWVKIAGTSMQADSEGGGKFYLTLTNITERVNAELILARDKETVERLVEERSKELLAAQRELEKARRLADIGELAATVAHELRNPLAAVGVTAANIRRKTDDEAIRRSIETIDKKVRESDQIINNLLFYSRLKLPHLEKVPLRSVLDDVAEELASRAGRGKRFILEWDGRAVKDCVIEADPLQLRELLMNVVNNAYDAIAPGGAIGMAAEPDEAGHVVIRVGDNGIGMAPEELPKIWRPFYSTKSKGTGLGLSVVNQIVALHGGTVLIESERGKGTTVTIRLPLTQRTVAGDGTAPPARPGRRTGERT